MYLKIFSFLLFLPFSEVFAQQLVNTQTDQIVIRSSEKYGAAGNFAEFLTTGLPLFVLIFLVLIVTAGLIYFFYHVKPMKVLSSKLVLRGVLFSFILVILLAIFFYAEKSGRVYYQTGESVLMESGQKVFYAEHGIAVKLLSISYPSCYAYSEEEGLSNTCDPCAGNPYCAYATAPPSLEYKARVYFDGKSSLSTSGKNRNPFRGIDYWFSVSDGVDYNSATIKVYR